MVKTRIIIALLCAFAARPAHATFNGPSTTTTLPSRGGDASCQQAVAANPEAYCGTYVSAESEAKAFAICGDATSFCEGGNAFALACVKQACEQSQANSNSASANCAEASVSCGDTSVTVNEKDCPNVIVEGEQGIGQCRRCRVKKFPDGSTKTKCSHCAVRYTSEARPY